MMSDGPSEESGAEYRDRQHPLFDLPHERNYIPFQEDFADYLDIGEGFDDSSDDEYEDDE